MKKRIFAAFAACALLLSGCAGGQTAEDTAQDTDAANGELRELTVVLDWYPNALHAFLYQAEQAGYFAEEGLTVNIQSPAGVNDAMSMVAAGKADIGLYYQQDVIQALSLIHIFLLQAHVLSPLSLFYILVVAACNSLRLFQTFLR